MNREADRRSRHRWTRHRNTRHRNTRHRWTRRTLLLALSVAVVGILATGEAWMATLRLALGDGNLGASNLKYSDSAHILLAPVAALWLAWVRRDRLRRCVRRGGLWGPVLALAGCLLGWWARSAGHPFLWHAGALLLVVGGVVSVLGTDLLKHFLPALAALVFLLPAPALFREEIAGPLHVLTVRLAQTATDLLGLSSDSLGRIAGARGDSRLALSLVLATFVFAFRLPLHRVVRALILASTPLLVVAVNAARWALLVLLQTGLGFSLGEGSRLIALWATIPLTFLLLQATLRLLRWALVPVTPYVLAFE